MIEGSGVAADVAVYLLDTNVLIHVLRGMKGRSEFLSNLLEAGHVLASCPITIAEVYAGMQPKEEPSTRRLVESLQFLPLKADIAAAAGLLKRDWHKKGRTLTIADTILAATAIAYGCTLVTENAKDFPMSNLLLLAL